MQSNKEKLLVILGPTAVGKTALSLELAKRFIGEIISADSRLFYRGMDIGTAKPDAEELALVKHHLVNVAEPDDSWSLSTFQKAAYKSIDDIHARGKMPILVGGSGQYIRAVTQGWLPPQLPPRPELRSAIKAWGEEIGVEQLHKRLARVDSQAATRMDKRNMRRIVRALEVIFASGKRFSQQSASIGSKYDLIQIGLIRDRDDLYRRIDNRIEHMLQAEWMDEVRTLIEKGYSSDLPSMSAIGYAQLIQHHNGEISKEEVIQIIKGKTRQFVRKQANWFKMDDPKINWFDAGDSDLIEKIEVKIQEIITVKAP